MLSYRWSLKLKSLLFAQAEYTNTYMLFVLYCAYTEVVFHAVTTRFHWQHWRVRVSVDENKLSEGMVARMTFTCFVFVLVCIMRTKPEQRALTGV